MQPIDFNAGWSYRHLNADKLNAEEGEPWTAVTIPHDAMIGEKRSPLAASGLNSGWFEGRDYEYVKQFTPSEALAGEALQLEFEGVYHNAEVWLDGEQLAFRPY